MSKPRMSKRRTGGNRTTETRTTRRAEQRIAGRPESAPCLRVSVVPIFVRGFELRPSPLSSPRRSTPFPCPASTCRTAWRCESDSWLSISPRMPEPWADSARSYSILAVSSLPRGWPAGQRTAPVLASTTRTRAVAVAWMAAPVGSAEVSFSTRFTYTTCWAPTARPTAGMLMSWNDPACSVRRGTSLSGSTTSRSAWSCSCSPTVRATTSPSDGGRVGVLEVLDQDQRRPLLRLVLGVHRRRPEGHVGHRPHGVAAGRRARDHAQHDRPNRSTQTHGDLSV